MAMTGFHIWYPRALLEEQLDYLRQRLSLGGTLASHGHVPPHQAPSCPCIFVYH